MKLNWFVFIFATCSCFIMGQSDVFRIQGGTVVEGQTIVIPIYFKDVSNTGVDTGTTNVGAFAIDMTVPTGLIASASIVRAGVVENSPVLIEADMTDLSQDRITWYVAFSFGEVPFFNLDYPDPGEHIANLTLTVNPATAGSQILFQVDDQKTFVQDEFGNITNNIANGKLFVDFKGINITTEGGDNLPQINSFTVNPHQISQGGNAELSWSVQGADSVSISPGVGSVASAGSQTVTPSSTTTYTLLATNTFGSREAEVTLTVNEAQIPIIKSFNAIPSSISPGETSMLNWVTENADSVTISDIDGALPTTGSVSVSPASTHTYTLTATNGSGTAQDSVSVSVEDVQNKPKILSFYINPEQPEIGESYTIYWDVDEGGATTRLKLYDQSDDGHPLVLPSLQGNISYEADVSKTYLLQAENSYGSVEATAFVDVGGLFEIVSFSADPEEVFKGRETTLSWHVSGADPGQIWIEPSIDTVNPNGETSGQETVQINRTTKFTLKAQKGIELKSATITVSLLSLDEGKFLYFPLVRDDDHWLSKIGLINLAPETVSFDIFRLQQSGDPIDVLTNQSLAPYESMSVDYNTQGEVPGWVRVFNKSQGIGAVGLFGWSLMETRDHEQMIATRASRESRPDIFVPHLAADTNQFYTLGALAVADKEGIPGFQTSGNTFELGLLSQNQAVSWDFLNLMEGDLGNQGWGLLSGEASLDQTIAGIEIFGRVPESGLSQAVGILLDSQTSTQLIFPHIAKDVTQFWTGCVVINPGDVPAQIETQIFNDEGDSLAGPAPFSLNSQGKHVVLVDKNTNDLASGASWVIFQADQPILGYMLFGSYAPDDRFAGFQSAKSTSNVLCFPYTDMSITENGGWTGLALVNPQTGIAEVRLELTASNGKKKDETTITLTSNQKWVSLVNNTFNQEVEKGDSVLVFSSLPLTGFEIFGKSTQTLGGILAFSWEFE